jgi:hypothetical protein
MMGIFRTSLVLLVTLASAAGAGADPIALAITSSTLYENTIDTGATTGFGGPNNNILIDDVLVPAARNPLNRPLAITSVTVLVSGTSADDVLSLWSYPVQADGSPGLDRALVATAQVTFDTFFKQVTFGGGSTPLFTITPDFTDEPGFGLFYIGLGSSELAGWQWADGPDANRATAFNHNLDVNTIFLNTSPGPPFPSHRSQFVEIQGSPIPEPATLTLLTAGLLVGFAKSRSRKRPT